MHAFSHTVGGCNASLPGSLPRRLKHQALPKHQVKAQQQRTTAQVAAVPAFTDDTTPGPGAAVAATPVQQQLQQQQQQHGWLLQTPWGNQQQQQQPQQQQQELHQQHQQLHDSVAAALRQEQQQQQQQEQPADAVLHGLQQCSSLQDVAALVSTHQHELALAHVSAALQQLCNVLTQPPTFLPHRQQQQLQQCLAGLAAAMLAELPRLGHGEVGQLLARFQHLGFRPAAPWMRSVLQHAGTELVHYTPAELALLLLTATQTAARHGALPGPDTPVVELLATRGMPQPGSFDQAPPAASSTPARSSSSSGPAQPQQAPQGQQPSQQQSQQQRRANTVLTSAWLQHFLSTFQPYIGCRSAHPLLRPAHMEAVISCLAALRVAPDRFWLYLFVRQMSAQLPACSPNAVVRMLSSLATLGYRLPDHVMLQVERQMGGAAALGALRAEECVDVVTSLAALRPPHAKPSEAWLRALLGAALRGSVHLSASAVVGLLAAAAALGLHLEPAWIDALLLQARGALGAMSPHEHVGLMDALAAQQGQAHAYRPGPLFMAAFMAQLSAHMPALQLQQQATLAVGLATVGYKPSGAWMGAFMARLLDQPVSGGDGEHLLALLRALRAMQYVPPPPLAQRLSGLIDGIQLAVPYQQLLLLREALDELQYQRGIMAVPGGPRRAAEAAAAAAAAARAADAAAEGAVAATVPGGGAAGGNGDAERAAGREVAAVPGVPSAESSSRPAAQDVAADGGLDGTTTSDGSADSLSLA